MNQPARHPAWLTTPPGITWTSVVVNILLTIAKIVAGFLCRSQSILADGLHSGSDLVTDAAVLAGLRVSGRPPDGRHHYGHRRVSTLVALFVGGALALAAVWVVWDAVSLLHRYLHHHPVDRVQAGLPFWLALGSVPVKELMFRVTSNVGRKSQDMSVGANAWHHRTDAFAALATAVGLGGVLLGGPSWQFLDPVTAVLLAGFLLVAAWRISAEAASELIDQAPAAAVTRALTEAVAGTRGVRSYHALRARHIGGKVEMDIHIQVDPHLTVRDGHSIAGAVKASVMQADPSVVEVIIHVEPAENDHDDPRQRPS